MDARKLFTINTRTLQGNITISSIKVATLSEAIVELDKRIPQARKSCFVNITPEQAKLVMPKVEATGRTLYPTKGNGFLLGFPKSEPVPESELLAAF
jgi:hypothetical protein